MADPALQFGMGQAFYFGPGARAEGPKSEAQRADSGDRVLGEAGSQSSGGALLAPPAGSKAEPRLKRFLAFWRCHMASPGTCWRPNSGGHGPLFPLNPPMLNTSLERRFFDFEGSGRALGFPAAEVNRVRPVSGHA